MVVTGAALFASCQPGGQSCSPEVCGPGQVRVLIDQCASLLATGEACDVGDPMDVCPPTDACFAGHCKTVGGFGLGDACIPGEGCKYNTTLGRARFCKSNDACGYVDSLPPFYCAAAVGYGHDCDSSFEAPACAPCQPGLACVQGQCRKKCAEVADCPCDSAVGAAGFACEAGTCCRPLQQPCDSAAECCSGLDCSGGQCCTPPGASCSADADCCGAATCVGGVCKKPCKANQPCQIPDKKGPCAAGLTVCDQAGNETCLPGPDTPSQTPEQCDGIDNDCDGQTDETYPQQGKTCDNQTVAGCQKGFTVPGSFQCSKGQLSCKPRACDTNNAADHDCYCKIAGAAIDGHGKPCGVPAATPCTPGVDACIPSFVCAGAGGQEECDWDNNCGPAPKCWTPADVQLPPDHCY